MCRKFIHYLELKDFKSKQRKHIIYGGFDGQCAFLWKSFLKIKFSSKSHYYVFALCLLQVPGGPILLLIQDKRLTNY